MNALKKTTFIIFAIALSGCVIRTVYHDDPSWFARPKTSALKNRLVSVYNAHIIHDNNSMVIVLPNKTFFNHNSANLTRDAHQALKLVAELTDYYPKSTISVIDYSNPDADEFMEMLTTERANRVVQYLWKLKIDASFMYGDGKSSIITENNKHFFTDCVVIGFRRDE